MNDITHYQPSQLAKLPHTEIKKLLDVALAKPVKSNPYTAQITRSNPSAFLFLVDQSGSMEADINYNGRTMTKAEAVAQIVNEQLDTMLAQCQRSEGIRDYFDVSLIGYGGDSSENANILWEGTLEEREFVKISELATNYIEEIEIEDEKIIRGVSRKTIRKVKTWLNPIANYKTPMKSALELAADLLERWIVCHDSSDCFPPVVFNITDGVATDAENDDELLQSAERIKQLHTNDGNVLLINIHISEDCAASILFPSKSKELPDDYYAVLLYNMSSEMPKTVNKEIADLKNCDPKATFIGMAVNADTTSLVQMLNIGTSMSMNQAQN